MVYGKLTPRSGPVLVFLMALLIWLLARWHSSLISFLVSLLFNVSQDPELPCEPWFGIFVLVNGLLPKRADSICEGVRTVTQ